MDEKKHKILIIDDDAFILNLYVVKFKKAGHEVETAKGGAEAMGKLKDGYVPDIILSDVVLPDVNGLDFLMSIRNEKLAVGAAYIMLTNQNSHEETERAKSLDVAGYIIKANLIPSEVVTKVFEIAENHSKK